MEREIDNENFEETENIETAEIVEGVENAEQTEVVEDIEAVENEINIENMETVAETETVENAKNVEEAETQEETAEDVEPAGDEETTAEETEPVAEMEPVEEMTAVEESETDDGANKKKKWIGNAIFYSVIALLLLGVVVFRNYWQNNYGGVIVDGRSMINTLYDGERLLMKYVDEDTDLERGDIIVVDVSAYGECSNVKGSFLIKRLIAIEGDKVRCQDGQIEICYAGTSEYQLLNEEYAYYTDRVNYDFGEYVVGEDEIFFLGDNRNNSCDSRYNQVGGSHLDRLYKEDDIYGVVPSWALKHQKILEKIFF